MSTLSAVKARHDPVRLSAAATYAVLLALAAVAWWVSDLRMSGMDNGPGSALGTFAFFLITWVVMMVAMMFPSVAPMVATYLRIQRGRRSKAMPAPSGATVLFVTGYLLIWSAAGVAAYLIAAGAGSVTGDLLAWQRGGRWLAMATLLAAAGYELTPWKRACLMRCRGPLSFVLECWRDGRLGALQMGVLHGAWCLGCCWALMAALFALGVMSLPWMALIGALIALEKLFAWQRTAVGLVIVLLAVLGIGLVFAPHDVPGLHVPNSGVMSNSSMTSK